MNMYNDLNKDSLNYSRLGRNLIIGSGKLARHFSYYLDCLRVPYSQVSRHQNSVIQIQEQIKTADRIYLAISDSALIDFIKSYFVPHKLWVHFSGALNVENAVSCHPLMSFSERLFDLETYKSIHFVISGVEGLNQNLTLKDIMPFLENSYSFISSKEKELYHSYCVIAGNFPVILWSLVIESFKNWKIPEEAFFLYLQANLDNFKLLQERALTGPLQRKDLVTIQKNLAALDGDENLQNLYKTFLKVKGVQL